MWDEWRIKSFGNLWMVCRRRFDGHIQIKKVCKDALSAQLYANKLNGKYDHETTKDTD